MHSRSHILLPFSEKLEELRQSVLTIADLAKRNLENAIYGLFERDDDSCNTTIANDEEIDALEMQIDREGLYIMSRFQPVASDLREVISSMRSGANIERIADQTVSIARRARKINAQQAVPELHLLDPVVTSCIKIFDSAVHAYKDRDQELALQLKAQDKELDRFNKEVNEALIGKMQDHAEAIPTYFNLIFISRCLERIGDHATSIGEDVVFAVSAEDIRHTGNQGGTSFFNTQG